MNMRKGRLIPATVSLDPKKYQLVLPNPSSEEEMFLAKVRWGFMFYALVPQRSPVGTRTRLVYITANITLLSEEMQLVPVWYLGTQKQVDAWKGRRIFARQCLFSWWDDSWHVTPFTVAS